MPLRAAIFRHAYAALRASDTPIISIDDITLIFSLMAPLRYAAATCLLPAAADMHGGAVTPLLRYVFADFRSRAFRCYAFMRQRLIAAAAMFFLDYAFIIDISIMRYAAIAWLCADTCRRHFRHLPLLRCCYATRRYTRCRCCRFSIFSRAYFTLLRCAILLLPYFMMFSLIRFLSLRLIDKAFFIFRFMLMLLRHATPPLYAALLFRFSR